MAIGQITISAADWIAARTTDRMAIMVAASRVDEHSQLGGNAAVAPSEDSGQSHLDQDHRQRSLLAAQESYRQVAARIKARLAEQRQSETLPLRESAGPASEHTRLPDPPSDDPKTHKTTVSTDATHTAERPEETAPAPLDADQERTLPERERQDGAEDKSSPLSTWEAAEARADAIAADAVFHKGLWADLFENADAPTDHLPVVED